MGIQRNPEILLRENERASVPGIKESCGKVAELLYFHTTLKTRLPPSRQLHSFGSR